MNSQRRVRVHVRVKLEATCDHKRYVARNVTEVKMTDKQRTASFFSKFRFSVASVHHRYMMVPTEKVGGGLIFNIFIKYIT